MLGDLQRLNEIECSVEMKTQRQVMRHEFSGRNLQLVAFDILTVYPADIRDSACLPFLQPRSSCAPDVENAGNRKVI